DRALVMKLARELLCSEVARSISRGKACAWIAEGLVISGERAVALRVLPLLEACRESAGDDPLLEAFHERVKNLLAQYEGDLASSVFHLERARAAFERAGDLRNALDCKANLGLRAISYGDPSAAEQCARELLATGERLGMSNL